MSAPFDPNTAPQYHGKQGPQQPYQQQASTLSHAEARAQAKGAKAQVKALRPWYKKKRYLIPLVLLAIILLTRLNGGGSESGTNAVPADPATAKSQTTAPPRAQATTKAPETKVSQAPGVGTTVKAGDWAFKVTKFKCGTKKVGSEFLNKRAQGQFCLMNLSVTNNGDQPGTLSSSNQKVLDKQGRTFSADDEASIYADEENALFEEINPGNTFKGLLVFDVPKNAKPVQASLAGGLFGIKNVANVDLT